MLVLHLFEVFRIVRLEVGPAKEDMACEDWVIPAFELEENAAYMVGAARAELRKVATAGVCFCRKASKVRRRDRERRAPPKRNALVDDGVDLERRGVLMMIGGDAGGSPRRSHAVLYRADGITPGAESGEQKRQRPGRSASRSGEERAGRTAAPAETGRST